MFRLWNSEVHLTKDLRFQVYCCVNGELNFLPQRFTKVTQSFTKEKKLLCESL